MNKIKKLPFISILCTFPFLAMTLTGCKSDPNKLTLHVLNMEDYIYTYSPNKGYDEPNLYDQQFKDYIKENYPEFSNKNIEVVYDTTDTNETLYSKLQTGKSNYDLICPSDYMIQKLMSLDMLEKINQNLVPNYYGSESDASPFFKNITSNIYSQSYKTKENYKMIDYSVGYMWGTLGIVYNPKFPYFGQSANPNVDLQKWESLWNGNYHKTFSIKNSMRDTYSVGIMETFKTELEALKETYEKSSKTKEDKDIYNAGVSDIFNRCSGDYPEQVFSKLYPLKDNSYGLEVDSGKQDIVTGKIGANIAWSGDAVSSIIQAADPKQVTTPFDLYYSIPTLGANIWFDGWVMPKSETRSDEIRKLAHAFLNYLSDSKYARKNMDYTGYTTCIAGDGVKELTMDLYDVRKDLITISKGDKSYNILYVNPFSNKIVESSYSNFNRKIDLSYKNVTLKYCLKEYEENEEGILVYKDSKEPLVFDKLEPIADKNNYYDRFIIDESIEPYKSATKVNLSYFFGETLSDDDPIIYTTQYCIENAADVIGGAFFAQFPSENCIPRLAVMRDYRENNTKIMRLWEDFKSNAFPKWAIVLIAAQATIIITVIVFIICAKISKNKLRKLRHKQENENQSE